MLAGIASAELQVKYDKFRDVTEVWSKPRSNFHLAVLSVYKGKDKPRIPDSIELWIVSSSKTWKYLNYHKVYCLADGKPIDLEESKRWGKVGKGYVLEIIKVSISFDILGKLAKAGTLKFKVGTTEFTPDSESRKDLVDLLEYYSK